MPLGNKYIQHNSQIVTPAPHTLTQHAISRTGDRTAAVPTDSAQPVAASISTIQDGHGVLVVDDKDGEKLIRECSGIVCLCLPEETADSPDLSVNFLRATVYALKHKCRHDCVGHACVVCDHRG